ncbi:DUF3027 domain-containing protein [Amycolatopsis sp. NBC_01488]|uniref:DUF3027 domain-containing protein n=1 Tax=Amycolatopsis sp. NBC_01488 TaxID=2903563 RepID=UPI003FA41110
MTLLLTLDDGSVQRKLADAVEFARAAVLDETPEEQIGTHVGVSREDAVTASHLFEAQVPGYRGWRWSVTVALAGDDEPVTVSEVVLVPGPSALIAPAWVPWERRVRAGDLGVGDIFPTDENDPRLVPAYLQSDDPSVEEVARDAGLGRVHVLSRFGRTEAATRWHSGEFGPRSDMARSAPDVCGTCGFFVPLAGSLRGVFGVCSNDIAPADGHVVDVEYGCGAHSEVEVEVTSSIPVAELVYDDSLLDFTPSEVAETPAAEPETAIAEADVSPAEVEPEEAAESAVSPEPTDAVAEPAAADPDSTQADAVAEPVAAEPVAAEPMDAVAEPTAAEPGSAQADPAAETIVAESTDAAAADSDSVQAEADEAVAETEPGAVDAQPTSVRDETAETPAAQAAPVEADVPEPAEAEPTQAEVTDAVVEPRQAEDAPVPEAVEPTQAEVTDAVAEPQRAEDALVPEAVEPAQAEAQAAVEAEVPEAVHADAVAHGAATPQAGEPAEAEASEPVVSSVPEPAEAEPTQAEVTDVGDVELGALPADDVGTEDGGPVAAAGRGESVEPAVRDVEPTRGEDTGEQRDL